MLVEDRKALRDLNYSKYQKLLQHLERKHERSSKYKFDWFRVLQKIQRHSRKVGSQGVLPRSRKHSQTPHKGEGLTFS